FHHRLFVTLSIQQVANTGQTVPQPFGCEDGACLQMQQRFCLHEIRSRLLVLNCLQAVKFQELKMIEDTFLDLEPCRLDSKWPWKGGFQHIRCVNFNGFAVLQLQPNQDCRREITVAFYASDQDQGRVLNKRRIEKLGFSSAQLNGSQHPL